MYFNVFDMMWGGNIKTRRISRPALPVLAAVGLEHKPPSEQEESDQREETPQFLSGPIL